MKQLQLKNLHPQKVRELSVPDDEKAVLASILIDATELPSISTIITPEHFLVRGHRAVFQSVMEIAERDGISAVDVTTVTSQLRRKGQLGEVGGGEKRGEDYLLELVSMPHATLNATIYAHSILRQAQKGRMSLALNMLAGKINTNHRTAADFTNEVETIVYSALHTDQFQTSVQTVREVGADLREHLAKVASGEIDPVGMTLPWDAASAIELGTSGYVLVAARPHVGKTALMNQLITHAVTTQGMAGHFLTMETKPRMLLMRASAAHARVNLNKVQKAELSASDMAKFFKSLEMLEESRLTYDNLAVQTPNSIRSKARALSFGRNPIDFFAIDYFQKIAPDQELARSPKPTQLEYASGVLQQTRDELDLLLIVAAQFNRSIGDRPPDAAYLKDTGSLEQDADIILGIHKPSAEESGVDVNAEMLRDIYVLKDRNQGTAGRIIPLYWDSESSCFRDRARETYNIGDAPVALSPDDKKDEVDDIIF